MLRSSILLLATAVLPALPASGAGTPILIVGTSSNQFSFYYSEILRTEGLNAFDTADIASVTASTLSGYNVVILGEMALSAAQVSMFSTWVSGGGSLIAMRPDKQLAGLLGIADAGATLSNGYLLVNTAGPPGAGIVAQTIQYHGVADRYTLNGATAVATLYSNRTTPTSNPAVTLRSGIGTGGSAAAFTYDLARSVIYTRQGNPAWAGQDRDGIYPVRSDDMFYGNASFDPQADWVDRNNIAIPQADEQQRLLANLILKMNEADKPIPRYWYFPFGKKAAVIMTGDDHAQGGTAGRFDAFIAASPAGCNVGRWECVRGTSYVYPGSPLTNTQAASYTSQGFEVGLHVSTNCADYTYSSLDSFMTSQLSSWASQYSSIPAPVTNRTHCIAWSDWISHPLVELSHGIRLDTNYYFYPPGWVTVTPGFMTGSGMPMRFAQANGAIVDVYQAMTQMTDESGQSYPATINGLLDNAVGPAGYYGAFTANMHTDSATGNPQTWAMQIVASAQSRGVPVVSSKQMLQWLDARNGSSFSSVSWSANTLSFTVSATAGATGLQAMLPVMSPRGGLSGITRNGTAVAYTVETVKGIQYAFFAVTSGAYQAAYNTVTVTVTPPSVSLSASQSQRFTATVGGTSNTVVSWSSSSPGVGTLDATGNYTAPPSIPASQGLTITATSAADPTKSGSAAVTLLSDSTPATISGIAVSAAATSATISWTTSKNTNSRVDYGTSPSSLNLSVANPALVMSHSLTLTGLTGATTYYYRITSADASSTAVSPPAGTSPASFSTFDPYPPVITAVAATAGPGGTARITWNTDKASNSRVDYGTAAGSLPLNVSDTAMVTAHSITLTGLTFGTTYYFRVTSVDTFGNSATVPAPGGAPASFVQNAATVWGPSATPAQIDSGDGGAVELGMRFRSDVAGAVTGIRFYKAAANTGTHTGHLWSTTGTLLGSVTFINETSSGWQQANFAAPIPIQANTTYVVSYFAPVGRYSDNLNYFSSAGVDSPPLHAPRDGAYGANGVYRYGSTSGFPGQTYFSTNYWVDVVFSAATSAGPVITAVAVAPGTTTATITWTTDVASNSRVDYGTSAGSLTLNAADAAFVTAHSITLTGLTAGTTYYYRVTSADAGGDSSTSPPPANAAASFNTSAPPPVISAVTAAPGSTTATITWTTDVASNSRVDYGTSAGSLTLNATNAALVTAHSISLSGLTAGTTYYYRVTSAEAGGSSSTSPPVASPAASFSTTAAAPVISAVAVTPGSTTATITWTTDIASNSRVDYGTSAGSLTLNAANATMVTAHSVSLTGLTAGTTYYYRVTSADAGGNSSTSPPVASPAASFNTTAAAPVISAVTVAPSSTAATITWTTDIASNSRVDYGTSATALTLNAANATMVTAHSISLTGLTAGTTYYYRVTSADAGGNSSTSPPVASPAASFNTTAVAPVISAVAVTPGSTSATITWTTDIASNSRVDYGTSAGSLTLNTADAAMVTAHSVSLTGLTAGTTYYYRVTSADAGGNSSTSPPVASPAASFNTTAAAPVISAVTAAPGSTTATITWTTDIASNSRVDYGTSAGSLTLNAADAAMVTAHSISLTGLTAGTTYYYRVTSADAGGNSSTSPPVASPAASFNTTAAAPVISAVTVAPSSTTATITWTTDVASNSRVDYGTSATALTLNAVNATMVTAHSISLTGLTTGTTYYYRVTSAEAGGSSSTSPPVASPAASFSTTAAAPVISAVAVTPGSTSATITWTTDIASNSRVDYGTSAGSLTLNAADATMVTAHSISLTGLTAGTTYYYRVTSADAGGNSSTSPPVASPAASFNTTAAAPVISAVTAAPGSTTATITWTTDIASNSRVDYGTSAGSLTLNAADAAMVTAHSISLTGLTAGTTYYYRVTSADAGGNSSTSPPVASPAASFNTTAAAPVISAVTAAPGSTTATITWTTDIASNSRVDYGTSAGSLTLNTADGTMVTAHSISLTGLTAGTTYYYRVTSADAGGNSSTSPPVASPAASFNTTAAAPVISAVTVAPSSTTATITWTTDIASNSRVDYGTSAGSLTLNAMNATMVTAHNISLTGLTAGTTYYYRVTSADAGGNSSTSPPVASPAASFNTTAAAPVISAVTAAPGSTTATITWTTDIASNSRVDYGTSATALTLNAVNATMVTAHSISLTGLTAGTTYYYRVTSADAGGNSSTSPPVASPAASFNTTAAAPVISAVTAAPGSTTATITWTTDTASNSRVDYGTSATALTLNAVNATMVTAHSISLTGLTAGTTYYYRVTSADAGGNSSTSPPVASPAASFNTTAAAPVISAVTATPGSTAATITWTTDIASNSRVDYGTSATALTFNAANATMITAHSISLTGLAAGATYYYRVTSADASGNSSTSPPVASPAASFSTTTAVPVISAVTAAPGSTTATITWTTDIASSSRVDYGTSAGSLTLNAADAAMVTAHSISLTGLTEGTTYYYRVTSADAGGNSSTSPPVASPAASFNTTAAAPVISAVTVAPSSTTATITWTTDIASNSRVDYGTSAGSLTLNTADANMVTAHSISLTGLTAGTTYYYRVISADAGGNSSTSPPVASPAASFNTTAAAPVISAVTVAPSSTTATITWTTDIASNSRVDYGTSATALTLNAVNATFVTAHSISLTGLTAGTTYYYRVTSADAGGNSSTSPPVASPAASFTTTAPPIISGLSATAGTTGATITWTTNVAANSRVDYGTSATALTSNAVNATLATAHSISLTGLTAGTTYYYRVTSADAAGNSSTSPPVESPAATFTTAALPIISNVTAVPGSTTATITWTTNVPANSRVDYGTSAGSLTLNVVNAAMVTAHSITLTGLTASRTYYYRVTSADAAGNSVTWPPVGTTAASFVTTAAPPVISAVTVTPGALIANVAWTTNVSSDSLISYGTSPAALTLTAANSSMVTSHYLTMTELMPATTYYFRVTSTRSGGVSSTWPAPADPPAAFATGSLPACPCTIWPSTAVPATPNDPETTPTEVGLKFQSEIAGRITGIRFYKGNQNTGTHVGHLWTGSGTLLATVTFANETASGWQTAYFATPVNISANTTYVVSYLAPNGHYAANTGYFSSTGADNTPLHALRNSVSANGVYRYGSAGGFPTRTFNATNYWVDVIFE